MVTKEYILKTGKQQMGWEKQKRQREDGMLGPVSVTYYKFWPYTLNSNGVEQSYTNIIYIAVRLLTIRKIAELFLSF